jgi:hypothetical protein
MTSMKKQIAEAKKLDRSMIAYAQKSAKHLGVPFGEAIRQMSLQTAKVAQDLDVTEAFVSAWTQGELAKIGRHL